VSPIGDDHFRDAGPSHEWSEYYRKTLHEPPRATLLLALELFAENWRDELRPSTPLAIDLGCGGGRDTVELLQQGWRVLAIDAEPDAIAALHAATHDLGEIELDTVIARFETFNLPSAQLINGSFALPLCPPAEFHELWRRMVAALLPGGRISGHLYGDRDSWAAPGSGKTGITFLKRKEVDHLLEDLEVERMFEEETDAERPIGQAKHWHIYHIVARKP